MNAVTVHTLTMVHMSSKLNSFDFKLGTYQSVLVSQVCTILYLLEFKFDELLYSSIFTKNRLLDYLVFLVHIP